jgi:hypothetical protein
MFLYVICRFRPSTSIFIGMGGICNDDTRSFHFSEDLWDAMTASSFPMFARFRSDLYEISITDNGFLIQTNLHTQKGRLIYTPMKEGELKTKKPAPPCALKKLVLDVPEDAAVPLRLLCPIKYSIFKDPDPSDIPQPMEGRTSGRQLKNGYQRVRCCLSEGHLTRQTRYWLP